MCLTQERGEGRLTEKVTKSDVEGGLATKIFDATQLKKTQFCEWRSFSMTPMIMFCFAAVFMSVSVDDFISFLWIK